MVTHNALSATISPPRIILGRIVLHISIHKLQLGHVDFIERTHAQRPLIREFMIRIRQTTVQRGPTVRAEGVRERQVIVFLQRISDDWVAREVWEDVLL